MSYNSSNNDAKNSNNDIKGNPKSTLDTVHISTLLKHYKREEVQRAIVENSRSREVAVKFKKGFGKRPDMLSYPKDVIELAKRGATSFHVSEERWSNPLALSTELRREELNSLRTGWDLVIDIDCHFIEYSKIAAHLIIEALEHHGIGCVSCKFSGNKGFHIGVPFEAFPGRVGGEETKNLFPEAPRRIAYYLKDMIKNPLSDKILELEDYRIDKIVKKTGLETRELVRAEPDIRGAGKTSERLDVDKFLEIDTLLISSRHLYRSVYSFNEKSGLVSVPVNPKQVLLFDKEDARPESIDVSEATKLKFLDASKAKPGEAASLLIAAYDHTPSVSDFGEERKNSVRNRFVYDSSINEQTGALPASSFPPCIKLILNGLNDGRKRSVFILLNFLRSVGWDYDEIEKLLGEWNERNEEPLRENIIKGHVNYHKRKNKKLLPPNCSNQMYYVDIGVCKPDSLCSRIRNPVNYAMIRSRMLQEEKAKKKAGRRSKAKPQGGQEKQEQQEQMQERQEQK